MIKITYNRVTLCLVLSLIAGLAPSPSYGSDKNSEDKPVRLYVNGDMGPIGKIERISESIINGRTVQGEQAIWGGEWLQAPAGRMVRVSLDQVGQVTLQGGTMAKLGVTRRRFDDNVDGAVLIASLITGKVTVKLQ